MRFCPLLAITRILLVVGLSIEYALIRDINDQPWRAELLAKRLRKHLGQLVHVNVIPLNPTPGSKWDASPKPVEREFVRLVNAGGVACTVRDTRGQEIAAACGQLAAEETELAGAVICSIRWQWEQAPRIGVIARFQLSEWLHQQCQEGFGGQMPDRRLCSPSFRFCVDFCRNRECGLMVFDRVPRRWPFDCEGAQVVERSAQRVANRRGACAVRELRSGYA